jgi:hypothetical protein
MSQPDRQASSAATGQHWFCWQCWVLRFRYRVWRLWE